MVSAKMTDVQNRPIVLIGAARSGTKFLRNVLSQAANHSSVPYDVNYVWRYGVENAPNDYLNPNDLSEKQIAFIRKTLPSLAKLSADDTLIEKTVSNTLRVPYVDRVFPAARYVHLVRDGRDVTESAMRLWTAPPDWSALMTKLRGMPLSNLGYAIWFGRNFISGLLKNQKGGNVWGPRFKNIETLVEQKSLAEICAMQWATSVDQATDDLAKIDPLRVFEIRYEDLVKDDVALNSLLDNLDIKDKKPVLDFWRSELHTSKSRKWDKLDENDKFQAMANMSGTLSMKGY